MRQYGTAADFPPVATVLNRPGIWHIAVLQNDATLTHNEMKKHKMNLTIQTGLVFLEYLNS